MNPTSPNLETEDEHRIASLITAFGSSDGLTRQQAREQLEEIGSGATTLLIEALRDDNKVVRWEAARTLQETEDPQAAPALVAALDDPELGVSWAAGEALIALGRGALPPLLEALSERPYSNALYMRAHHVLHELAADHGDGPLREVLNALGGVTTAQDRVPVAAYKALESMAGRG
jgi:HEAT repeat protein